MAELRQLAISAKDPLRLAAFYQQVFELKRVYESQQAICLSDGTFNLAFLKAQAGQASGLYSEGFRVEDVEETRERLERRGAKVSKGWSFVELGAADPDGNILGFSAKDFSVSPEKTLFPIRHIALYTPDPKRMADFYGTVCNMKPVADTDRSSVFISDGYLNLALLYQRPEEKLGLNHFGFHVRSIEEMRQRAEKAGTSQGAKRPDRIPFAEVRLHDPEGNGIDISVKGWKA